MVSLHVLLLVQLTNNLAMVQIQDSEDWEKLDKLETLTLSDIANLCPKASFAAIAKLPALQRVCLRGSMPADSQAFKTLLHLANDLGARGIAVET